MPNCYPQAGRGPVVRWSKPANGLSLGIEATQSPFRFVPTLDGGAWDEGVLVRVFLRNETDQTIYWSREYDAWSVTLTAPNLEEPKPWLGSLPIPMRDPPIPLAPGAVDSITLHMQQDLRVWPRIQSGRFDVYVTYGPTHLLTWAHGGEVPGDWVHPYDVPGFWTGDIETPVIAVQVDAESKL